LHEWQNTNRQMSLWSELETLGQNAINASCAPSKSSLSDENCVHFDDLRNLMKMQDYNVSTEILTSDTASLGRRWKNQSRQNRPRAANSQLITVSALWKLHFRPSNPYLRHCVHLFTSFTSILMMTEFMYCSTQNRHIVGGTKGCRKAGRTTGKAWQRGKERPRDTSVEACLFPLSVYLSVCVLAISNRC
jgi:hypothetical protein